MKKIFIAAAIASVALVSCQKGQVVDPNEMRLDVRFPGATKATAISTPQKRLDAANCKILKNIMFVS